MAPNGANSILKQTDTHNIMSQESLLRSSLAEGSAGTFVKLEKKPSIADLGLNIVGVGVGVDNNDVKRKSQVYQDIYQSIPRDQVIEDLDFQFLNFDKNQPPSKEIIEHLFNDLLQRRSFTSDAIINLRNFSLERKWTLICQDQLSENQSFSVKTGKDPEWFLSKLKYLTAKELHLLERYLRGKEFVTEFLALDGHNKLMDLKFNNFDEKKEFLIISCYKSLVNDSKGTDLIVQNLQIITFFVNILITSTKLINKKIITDILILLSYWSHPLGRNNVLKGFNLFTNFHMLKPWMNNLDLILNEDYEVFSSLIVKELMLSSLLLIISLCENGESINDKKIILFKLKEDGLHNLLYKFKLINDDLINEKVEQLTKFESLVFEDNILKELNLEGSTLNMNFKSMTDRIASNDTLHDLFSSLLKALNEILIKNSQTESIKVLKLINNIIEHISQSRQSFLSIDSSESIITSSIQRLMDQLTTDDLAHRAVSEMKNIQRENITKDNEIRTLKDSLALNNGDLLSRNAELQDVIVSKDTDINRLKESISLLEKQIQKFRQLPTNSSKSKAHFSHTNSLLKSLNQRKLNESNSESVENSSILSGNSLKKSKTIFMMSMFNGSNASLGSQGPSERRELDGNYQYKSSSSFEDVPVMQLGNGAQFINNGQYGNGGKFVDNVEYGQSPDNSIHGSITVNTHLGNHYEDIPMSGSEPFSPVDSPADGFFSSPVVLNSTESLGSQGNQAMKQTLNQQIISHNSQMTQSTGFNNPIENNQNSCSFISLPGANNSNHSFQSCTAQVYGSNPQFSSSNPNFVPLSSTISLVTVPPIAPTVSGFLKSNYDIGSNGTNSTISAGSIHMNSYLPESARVNNISPTKRTENIVPSGIQKAQFSPPPPPPLPDMLLNTGSPISISPIDQSNGASASGPLPPPPLPPPMPDMLKDLKLKEETPAPAPPPPPPPLPDMLQNQASKYDSSAPTTAPLPPPPPPPPQPDFLKLTNKSEGSLPLGPPPPPPPPDFLKSKSTESLPIPPPPFPVAKNLNNKAKLGLILSKNKIDEISKSLQPSKKLKQLHWEKIDEIEDTLWYDTKYSTKANELQALGILTEVEDLFRVKEIVKKETVAPQEDKLQLITFLPRDLSQQFGINLHMFANIPEDELIHKILACDNDILNNFSVLEFLNRDDLCEVTNSALKEYKPYMTNHKTGVKPKKDTKELERSDRLYLELCVNLRHYWRSRSRALLVIKTYDRDYYDLLGKLQRVDDSIQAIKNSKNLKDLFLLIREIGNFMNRKQIHGFKLSSLQKLSFIKDSNNETSLLHYVERIVRRAYPEYLGFLQELSLLQETSKISIEQLSQDINTFVKSVQNIERSMESGNLSDPSKFHPDDKVLKKLKPKLPEAKRKIQLLEAQHELVLKDFEKIMKYFGENVKDTVARSVFLESFLDFINDFKKAQTENLENEEKQKIYEKRKEMMLLQNKKAKELRTRSVDDFNEKQEEEDVVENLLKRLKGVSNLRRRTSTSDNLIMPTPSRRNTDNNELLSRAQSMLEGTKNLNV